MLEKYLPIYMREYRQIKEICGSEDPEITALKNGIDGIKNEMFALSAEDEGLKRFEGIYGITASEGESAEYRRFRIFSRLMTRRESLTEYIDALIPDRSYVMRLDCEALTLFIRLPLKNGMYLEAVTEMLERIVPVNIALDISLMFTMHSELEKYTHGGLKSYTHKYIKEELYEH